MRRKCSPTGRRPGRPKRQAPDEFNAGVMSILQWATNLKPMSPQRPWGH